MRALSYIFAVFLLSSLLWASPIMAEEPKSTVSDSFSCAESASKELSTSLGSEWISKVQARYRAVKTLQADFTQASYLKSLDYEEESAGAMWFVNPGRLRWEYSKPEAQTFLVRDREFELYQPLDRQLLKQDIGSYFRSDVPIAFLLGIGNLSESFKFSAGCTIEQATEQVVILILVPKIAGEGSKEVRLRVSKKDRLPIGLRVEDYEGDHTTFILSNRKVDSDIPKERFTLNVPSNTDIQDLRKKKVTALQERSVQP